ncbi:histidine kinase [Mucilaginibacter gracilis]|uniref:Histidine kinase n=1 Tax=Mucilaginibacter gracilis TaxID=423350 RepID=A0A495J0Z5_9SPHI|nr:sensor histidine kinase [Mucilaginibacter gracilis]RKR82423.1 histidine kinase [Mucilaginibacter gracilis]
MKPKLLLLSVYFIAFYLFTDFNWQINNYLNGYGMYRYLQYKRGIVSEFSSIFCFLLGAIVAYFNFTEFFYKRRLKGISVMVYLLLAIPIMIVCRYLVQEVLVYRIWGFHNYSENMRQPLRYFLDNIYFNIYYSGFGVVFFFIQYSVYNQKKESELMLQNRNAQLSFLRSQINPHFLFNSLNNVYTLVYQGSAKALPSISKLSELLRYMLYEKVELVPLNKEVQYLLNYIDLQLMRYNFEPAKQINIHVPPNSKLLIAPLVLIPFVENAFKHGDLKDTEQPLLIDLSVEEDQLNFTIVNKKSNFNKDEAGGIGLDNVKKRLMLIYEAKHQLNIEETADLFTVNLSIKIHE